jgi:hypothetical protein
MSAIARWDAFLGQIAARHRGVLADAEASLRAQVLAVAGGGDYLPISHAMMAINSRLQELESMIEDTWHAKAIDAILDETNHSWEIRDREHAKAMVVKDQLDDEREMLEPRVFALLARERFNHALAAHQGMIRCAGCGAGLETPVTFRAIELPCRCGVRTTFEPGELMRSVAAIGAHAVAQEAVITEWKAMVTADRARRRHRSPTPLHAIQTYEAAQITYWRAYLAVRSRYEPELARDPVREVRDRMEQWYTMYAEHEELWVKAGRPRAPI